MKKFVTYLLLVVLSLSLATCTKDQTILPDNFYIRAENERPWVIAHGGAKALWPENTMEAFSGSMALGVDVLEMDIRITKDGVLVCHHDADIENMSDDTGRVWNYTYQELLQFNFGDGFTDLDGNNPYKNQQVDITRLEDVFKAYPNVFYVVEIKDTEQRGEIAGDSLKALIERYQLTSKTMVASFDEDVLVHFRETAGNSISTSASQKETTKFVLSAKAQASYFYHPNAVAFQLPVKEIGIIMGRSHVIKAAHRHNMAVHFWTINDKEEMRDLIEKGADGLITDRPDLLFELLEEMGW
jgi:glycerophosphoryl diester phosphodiesterase